MSLTAEKNDIERKLCLYFIFKNSIAFRDFFIPKAWGKVFYSYYYQYPPALSKELAWAGARGTGKSLDLEFSILQRPFGNPSEETLLTAFRKSHIKDRLEKVISYYAAVPYLRRFLKGDSAQSLRESVTRSPVYSIRFKNNHEISGISVGEDPAAISIQGRHPCLHEHQGVRLADGTTTSIAKIIRKVRRKEKVFVKSYDLKTNKIVDKLVVDGWFSDIGRKKMFRVVLEDNSPCLMTGNHRVYVEDNKGNFKLKHVDALRIGIDCIVSDKPKVMGGQHSKKVIKISPYEKKVVKVCDISVKDTENFFTSSGFLVSNCYRYLEEGHSYTKDAWLKFQNTQASTGSQDRFYGIPNGMVDTPFYEILHRLKKFKNKKFRVHKALEPNWTQETKREKLATLKGPNSNDWLQEIEAQDGEPSFGVWNEADLRKNIDFSESTEVPGALMHQILTISITAKDYVGLDPNQALHNLPLLPEPCDVILGIDAGYSQPTIILPFFFYKNKWCLRCKILLLDRMISDDQTELIDYVASFYNAFLGIDCSSADGRDIATKLCNPKNEQYANKQYDKRVAFIDFREALIVGYKKVKKGGIEVLEEIKENMKNKSTSILRDKFSNSDFNLYYDEELIPEFISETQKSEGGRISINTPTTVHIPEAFRCFAGAFFKLRMTVDMPELEQGEDSEEYSFEYPKYEPDTLGLFGREKADKAEENLA